MSPPQDGRRAGDWRRTWLARRAVFLHLTVVVVVPTFLGLFWWQVQRVRQGNTLSWAYVFEWPFFTGYAIYLWWRLVHEQPELVGGHEGAGPGVGAEGGDGRCGQAPAAVAAADPGQEDEELAAYNRYLAELAQLDAAERRPR